VTALTQNGGMELTDDMQRVVREQSLGFVATVRPDGTPALSPKGTTTVWDAGHLVFLHLYLASARVRPAPRNVSTTHRASTRKAPPG
jgi:hypothetical protein